MNAVKHIGPVGAFVNEASPEANAVGGCSFLDEFLDCQGVAVVVVHGDGEAGFEGAEGFGGASDGVHLVVLETFRPEHHRDQGYRAKWIDGNKLNNKLSNLEWEKKRRKRLTKRQRMQRDLRTMYYEME